ncbi:MAG: formylglycine-generating enzyme family protein [Spirulina sp. SIO3F2]|nr:formylglycine-generating enzyme family protein [Spirulina sp. SIO3F2]
MVTLNQTISAKHREPTARLQSSGQLHLCIGVVALLLTSACTATPETTAISATPNCGSDEEFVAIPPGEFIRGSDRAERDYAYEISGQAAAKSPSDVPDKIAALRKRRWFEREPSLETVTVAGFCLGRNLVTNAEYHAFVVTTEYREPGITAEEYQTQGFLVHPYSEVEPYLWQQGQYPEGEAEYPVVLVSVQDAIAYAEWKGQQDGYTYRLPTAKEWEKAARGTDGQYFPWGNDWQDDATNWAQEGEYHTSAIAAYPLSRSTYGVEDMAGNVFEWTSTRTLKAGRPAAMLKGCSWDDLPGFCRAAYQHSRPLGSRHILFGFRLVREVDAE